MGQRGGNFGIAFAIDFLSCTNSQFDHIATLHIIIVSHVHSSIVKLKFQNLFFVS